MFKEKTIKEKLKIENGKAYAVFSSQEDKRMLNGCETRNELAKKILEKRQELEEISDIKNKVSQELAELLTLDNELVGIGCCSLSRPVYKTIDGIIQKDRDGNSILDHYTHDEYCSHKEN